MIRTLRHGEQEALLHLLDRWPIGDGWRARDFFRRYLELDPTFRVGNVWVAEEAGALVSCLQIFPRVLRGAGGSVRCGGIGSVFTRPEARKRGLAGALLEAAADAMRRHGMVVSLLQATRVRWYGRYGWHVWCDRLLELRRSGDRHQPRASAIESAPFDRERDLEALCRLAQRYRRRFVGIVDRDRADWEASLQLAGNPREHIRVARRAAEVVAYLRATDLEGRRQVTEWGRTEGGAAALAALLDEELAARISMLLPRVPDEELKESLRRRELVIEEVEFPAWMLRCLDIEALAGGDSGSASEKAILETVFPRARFGFWTSDRF